MPFYVDDPLAGQGAGNPDRGNALNNQPVNRQQPPPEAYLHFQWLPPDLVARPIDPPPPPQEWPLWGEDPQEKKMAVGHKLGKPVNIDSFLGKAKARVTLVGVELEGGWSQLPTPKTHIERDGSVRFDDDASEKVMSIHHIGELASPPLEVKEYPAWMRLYYPYHSNASCGLHVHMSFKRPFIYQRLMVPTYPGTIVEYLKRWAEKEGLPKTHPIWPRLAGKSEYCQHVFQADEQIGAVNKDYDHHRVGHRYSLIAYRWGRFKTVECRLLPMMETPEQGIRAVQHIIDITDAFLAATATKETKVQASVDGEDSTVVKEKKVYA